MPLKKQGRFRREMITQSIDLKEYNDFQDYEKFILYFHHSKTGELISVEFKVNGNKATCSIDENITDILFDKSGKPKFMKYLKS
jgi:hypothetical protein